MWTPQSLSSRHIIAAALVACGNTNEEIAQALGLCKQTIVCLQGSQLFQNEVQRHRDKLASQLVGNAVSKLQGETVNSVDTILEIRDNLRNSPHVRLRAADSILDRVSSTSKIQKTENKTLSASFTNEQIETLIRSLEDDPIAREAFREASQKSFLELASIEDSEHQ